MPGATVFSMALLIINVLSPAVTVPAALRIPAVTISQYSSTAAHASPIMTSVQRLLLHDMNRFVDECWGECHIESMDIGRIESSLVKSKQWGESRLPIVIWATNQWLKKTVKPVVPISVTMMEPSTVTLSAALKPIRPKAVAVQAFRVSPFQTIRLGWRIVRLWIATKVLPPARAERHNRRNLQPLMTEIASTYSQLVERSR